MFSVSDTGTRKGQLREVYAGCPSVCPEIGDCDVSVTKGTDPGHKAGISRGRGLGCGLSLWTGSVSQAKIRGMDEQTLEQIHLKLAFLERANSELSDVVFRQQREIQALSARIKEVAERASAGNGGEERSPEDERPPHY